VRGKQLAPFSSERNSFSEVILRSIGASQLVFLILLGGWAPFLRASTPQFQKAVVLRIEKFQPTLPYRRRLADSPPPPTEYDFEVSLRVGCLVYVGLYQTAIDYLPDAVAPDQPVEVTVERHVMHIRVSGGREIKLEIVRHYKESTGSCSSGR